MRLIRFLYATLLADELDVQHSPAGIQRAADDGCLWGGCDVATRAELAKGHRRKTVRLRSSYAASQIRLPFVRSWIFLVAVRVPLISPEENFPKNQIRPV